MCLRGLEVNKAQKLALSFSISLYRIAHDALKWQRVHCLYDKVDSPKACEDDSHMIVQIYYP